MNCKAVYNKQMQRTNFVGRNLPAELGVKCRRRTNGRLDI